LVPAKYLKQGEACRDPQVNVAMVTGEEKVDAGITGDGGRPLREIWLVMGLTFRKENIGKFTG